MQNWPPHGHKMCHPCQTEVGVGKGWDREYKWATSSESVTLAPGWFVFVYLYLCICICVSVGIFLKAHLQQEPLSLDPHAPPPAPVPGPQAAPPTWVWKSWYSWIREGLTLPELSISWHCQHWLNPTITHPLRFDINIYRYMLWQKCVNDHFWEWMITVGGNVVEWSKLWDKCYLFVDIDHF